jgi:hypothetical protein
MIQWCDYPFNFSSFCMCMLFNSLSLFCVKKYIVGLSRDYTQNESISSIHLIEFTTSNKFDSKCSIGFKRLFGIQIRNIYRFNNMKIFRYLLNVFLIHLQIDQYNHYITISSVHRVYLYRKIIFDLRKSDVTLSRTYTFR